MHAGVLFEVGGRENAPGILGTCATHNVTYLVRGPWLGLMPIPSLCTVTRKLIFTYIDIKEKHSAKCRSFWTGFKRYFTQFISTDSTLTRHIFICSDTCHQTVNCIDIYQLPHWMWTCDQYRTRTVFPYCPIQYASPQSQLQSPGFTHGH